MGFANRRTKNLKAMTSRYLTGPWEDVRELPGIGEYAARAWEIFCLGIIGDHPPKDHALVQYWHWLTSADAVVLQQVFDVVPVHEERHVGGALEPRTDADQVAITVEGAAA